MEKEFVPYEQALVLKELGFDEPCFGFYLNGKVRLDGKIENCLSQERVYYVYNANCLSPTFSQAFRWFRKNYGLEHKIIRDSYGCRYQITKVTRTSIEEIDCKGQYSNTSYDEVELECLKKLISIVKNK